MNHAILLASPGSNSAELATFWVLAILAVGAALGMILTRRAVHCAVLLAVVMLILAAMYAMQGAPFLAFVQVIVYTGAVLMLFLFVMMIVGISAADSIVETIKGQRLWAGLAGIALWSCSPWWSGTPRSAPAVPAGPRNSSANVTGLAKLIFTTYVFPFEVTSALLITAALGAMVLAHRERTSPKPTQRMLSRQRVAQRQPGAAARPRHLRPAQRRRHAGAAARRQPVRLSVSGVLANRAIEESAGGRPGDRHRGDRARRASRCASRGQCATASSSRDQHQEEQ